MKTRVKVCVVYEREKYCESDGERGRACDRVKKIERE